jgi:hypothetical protein
MTRHRCSVDALLLQHTRQGTGVRHTGAEDHNLKSTDARRAYSMIKAKKVYLKHVLVGGDVLGHMWVPPSARHAAR